MRISSICVARSGLKNCANTALRSFGQRAMGKKKKPVPIVPLAAPPRAPRRREVPATASEPSPAPPQPARPPALTSGRPTLWASHTPTDSQTTGLGRELAGTSRPISDAPAHWAHAEVPDHPPAAARTPAPLVALALEIRRSELLQSLRGQYVTACHAQAIASPPMHAFERWRFLCKWEEEAALGAAAAEPLLPTEGVGEAEAAAAAAEGSDGSAAASASAAAAEAQAEAEAEVAAAAAAAEAEAAAQAATGARPASKPRTAREWLCHDLRRAGVAAAAAARIAAQLLCSSAEAAAQLTLTLTLTP